MTRIRKRPSASTPYLLEGQDPLPRPSWGGSWARRTIGSFVVFPVHHLSIMDGHCGTSQGGVKRRRQALEARGGLHLAARAMPSWAWNTGVKHYGRFGGR